MSALGQKRTLRPLTARQARALASFKLGVSKTSVKLLASRRNGRAASRITWDDAGVILAVIPKPPRFLLRARVRFRLLAHQTNRGIAARCGHSDPSTHNDQPNLAGAAAVVPLAPDITSLRADLPDDAGSWNLNQRSIGRVYEFGVCTTLPKVSYGTVVDDIGATVGPESEVGRTIEPMGAVNERLVARLVFREPRDLERKRLTNAGKVDVLHHMTDLIRPRICRREA